MDGVELEFEGAEFDKRLATRVEGLAGAMAREPSASFPQALSAAELEAAYRFFSATSSATSAKNGELQERWGSHV